MAYFVSTSAGLAPEPIARGPWSDQMLHGRLLGGLAARAIETEHGQPWFRAARLTVDLFRPGAMAPATVTTTRVRDGRRIRVVDATVVVGGHEVARASCVLLAESSDPPGQPWRPQPWVSPHPDTLETRTTEGLWEVAVVEGGFGTDDRARIWTRETATLVDDEPLSPFVRVAVSGDLASPLANSSSAGLAHINADYTLAMARYPRGEWIGLEAAHQLADSGISSASCMLYDLDGPFALSTAVALANPPLPPPSSSLFAPAGSAAFG